MVALVHAARYVAVGAIARRTSVVPLSSWRETSKPASSNTRSIGELSGITSATKVVIPAAAAGSASCSSSRVPTPWPWSSSATANATSAHDWSRRRTKFASATTRSVCPSSDSVPISDPLSFQSGSTNGSTVAGASAGKPWKRW